MSLKHRCFRIYFWHAKTKRIEDEIRGFCCFNEEDGQYYYLGNLDGFADEYKRNFIFMPTPRDKKHNGVICVTEYNSFNAR